MKRVAAIAFYALGAIAVVYLALYAYALWSGRQLRPGDPIHIFRNPDAPDYSSAVPAILGNPLGNRGYASADGVLRPST
jgi:hypothetical protein